MRITWRTELPQLLLIAAMFAAGGLAWSRVPEKLPVHWNFAGEVDRYGGRFEGLFAIPLFAIGLYGLLLVLPRIDPHAANDTQFATVYLALCCVMVAFMALIQTLLLVSAFGHKLPMTAVVMVATGTLLAVLGALMPRVRPNWFVGIRTPWTLSSERSWERTHKLAAWMFPIAGLALASTAFVPAGWAVGTLIAIAAGSILWLVVYSYLVWRNDDRRGPAQATSTSAKNRA
ncbi:MAG: SdpI family protein [Planctomycetaceae bacterium]|nr:SdpI family protein [Planctomycetaceae bacterium]